MMVLSNEPFSQTRPPVLGGSTDPPPRVFGCPPPPKVESPTAPVLSALDEVEPQNETPSLPQPQGRTPRDWAASPKPWIRCESPPESLPEAWASVFWGIVRRTPPPNCLCRTCRASLRSPPPEEATTARETSIPAPDQGGNALGVTRSTSDIMQSVVGGGGGGASRKTSRNTLLCRQTNWTAETWGALQFGMGAQKQFSGLGGMFELPVSPCVSILNAL